jgi:hypothetical protein
VPEHGEAAAVLRRPVEEPLQSFVRFVRGQVEVAFGRERDVHGGKRDLDELARRLPLEIPWTERMRDAGPETEGVAEAERGVVCEARGLELAQVAVRVEPEEVVPLALH